MLIEISSKAVVKDLEKGSGGSPGQIIECASAGRKELFYAVRV